MPFLLGLSPYSACELLFLQNQLLARLPSLFAAATEAQRGNSFYVFLPFVAFLVANRAENQVVKHAERQAAGPEDFFYAKNGTASFRCVTPF
jgi:hypothetical protein